VITDVKVAARHGGVVPVTASELEELEARVERPLLRQGDEGWDDAVLIWNGMVSKAPALVLQPTSTREVATAVNFARDRGLLLGVKGGGHNIAGTAIADRGLTLDMSRMRDVVVDPEARLARVGPGCRLGDLDRATQEHGLATVLGFFSEVGVAGLTLGGGIGYLARRFGFTVDNLHEVEVVTADGQIRRASRDENIDLFWGVRGAGANLGVVTEFTFRLHEVGPTVYGGLVAWPHERIEEILSAYRTLTEQAPRTLTVFLLCFRAPPAPFVPERWHGERICAMAVCYTGDMREVDAVMAPIRALGDPAVDLLGEQPYVQLQSYLDATEPKGDHYYWKTGYVSELTDDLLSAMGELASTCPIPRAEIGFLHIGGALNERAPDDGVVGNRDARYAFGAIGVWDADEPEEDAFTQWIRDAWSRVDRFSTGGSYINFQTADEDRGRIEAAYGANFARLVELKQKYDPDNLFRVNRNVSPVEQRARRVA
jgi:FAD/FMN-containing dehydrogenase